MTTTTTTDEPRPLDFACCGLRVDRQGKALIAIRAYENGALGAEMAFSFKRREHGHMHAGSVYTGARFSSTQAIGLPVSKWVRKWPVAEDRIEWEARHAAALESLACAKLERDETAVADLQRLMLPLRRRYAELLRRYDMAGTRALETAVVSALQTPPRRSE